MTIIDLGEITTDYEPPGSSPRRLVRPIALAMVALLTLVTVTASVTPQAPRGVRPLWSAPIRSTDGVVLDDDTVFVYRLEEGGLTAYDMATGAERWTVDAGELGHYPDLVSTAGVLLLPVALSEFQRGGSTVIFVNRTVALDHATGARLWERNAGRLQVSGDQALLGERDAAGRVIRLRLVRLRDGGTIWTRALTANSGVTAAGDTVVTVDDHGAVTVLRWADGSVLRAGAVPWTPDRDAPANEISIVGGLLVHSRSTDQATSSIVYRLDTLAEAWRSDGYVSDCGVVLCSPEGDDQVGRDPVTGAERWRLTRASQPVPIGPGRLLSEDARDNEGLLLIDAATGRRIATLGPGQVLWGTDQSSDPFLLVRSAFVAPLHNTVIQVDRRTGEQFTLGATEWIGDGNPACQAARGYLVCPGHDRLYVTAVGRTAAGRTAAG